MALRPMAGPLRSWLSPKDSLLPSGLKYNSRRLRFNNPRLRQRKGTVTITAFSIHVFPRMAIGLKQVTTGMCFVRTPKRAIGPLIVTVTGFGLIAGGSGTQTSILAWQPITIAAGFDSPAKVGAGCQVTNGRQPGFPGVIAVNTTVGRRSLRKPT